MKAKQSSCGCDCVNIFDDILKRLSDLELMHIDVKWVKEKMENLYPDIFEINNEDKS